jgi:hypothetical protein
MGVLQTYLIGGEGARDGGCGFNGLGGGCYAAHDDFVGIDGSSGTRAVTVRDLPGCAGDLLAGVGMVVVVTRELGRWLKGRECPAGES